MPAYLIARVEVTDPNAYENYKKLAAAAIEKYQGRYLARGGRTVSLEGPEAAGRLVIVEFASVERAQEFYHSPDYQRAIAARSGAAEAQFVVVDGV